jgi:hypothetical protein
LLDEGICESVLLSLKGTKEVNSLLTKSTEGTEEPELLKE